MINYQTYRPKIHTGDILAFPHKECKSWYDLQVQSVLFATKSPMAHVAMAWRIGPRVMVFEAVVPKVRVFPLSAMGNFYHFPMHLTYQSDAVDCALREVGKEVEYSKWEGIKALFRLNDPADKKTQCAEFVKNMLLTNNIILPGRAVPGDVVEDLMQLGIKQAMVHNEILP